MLLKHYRQLIIAVILTSIHVCRCQAASTTREEEINQIIQKERQLLALLQSRTPLAQIYIQLLGSTNEKRIVGDEYFFGRTRFGVNGVSFAELATAKSQPNRSFPSVFPHKSQFLPRGFVQMALMDNAGLDRERYAWEYKRQEFLGETRCWVFDVTPKKGAGYGRFIGRIWVAEKDYAIIRFDGTYSSAVKKSPYFHFDSWRINGGPGFWLPAAIYVEEVDLDSPAAGKPMFKAVVNFWGYQPLRLSNPDEFTSIQIEAGNVISHKGSDAVAELPRWQQQGEVNVLEWLQAAGLLAPPGEVDKVMETVVNNLLAVNDVSYDSPVKCRVLLTLPLESFTLNNTIVLSRGLIDVLPDEASLALMLARELAHVLLGHRVETKYAFNDRILADESAVLKNFNFRRGPEELDSADAKAIELLSKSPYRDTLSGAALFLRAVSKASGQMPDLFRPLFGDRPPGSDGKMPMNRLVELAPAVDDSNFELVAALPLSSRVKVDPWSDMTVLGRAPLRAPLNRLENVPFEILPVMLNPILREAAPPPGELLLFTPVRSNLPAWPAWK